MTEDVLSQDSQAWARKWSTDEYASKRRESFEKVDAYLNQPIKNILDIGCGFAWESRFFNEKYGCDLWLIDGDSSANSTKPENASYGNWNTDESGLKFYHTLDFLDNELTRLGTKNYRLIDANNINIPEDMKFDLITSWLSCGHHYPVDVYRELMLKHSHANTRIVVDLRRKGKAKTIVNQSGFEVINIINDYGKKRCTAEIKLI